MFDSFEEPDFHKGNVLVKSTFDDNCQRESDINGAHHVDLPKNLRFATEEHLLISEHIVDETYNAKKKNLLSYKIGCFGKF